MRCHWLRIDDNRLVDLGEHDIMPHQVEMSVGRAAAKLALGMFVNFPASDTDGLKTIKNALAYRGVRVKGLESD